MVVAVAADLSSPDLLSILTLDFNPRRVCWVHRGGASLPLLAVTDANSSRISIYDGRGGNTQPLSSNNSVHRKPVNCLSFNNTCNCVVSADDSGMIEYWDPASFEKPDSVFELKTRTDLFAFKKTKSVPSSITMSPTGEQLATFSFPDRQVRIFDFASGKLYRSYDESLATVTTMQQAGTALAKLDEVDFGRRIAIERNLDNPTISPRINVLFDESGHFVLYGSLLGIKCINTFTNRVVRLYGRDEPFRPLNLVLYQGAPQQKGLVTVDMAASANPLLQEAGQRDPLLAATAVGKVRFYLFTNEAASGPPPKNRDVFNEKPTTADGGTDAAAAATAAEAARQAAEASTSAVLHTTMGDITLRLFPAHAPKTVRNFTGHATSGYYNNTRFHRVIPKFMIQGGDPLGDGTGGESIWGGEFEDEISDLKHDRPYTLSMANAGPNTNASQFFITTERTPWLDGRHTIFGRVVRGMDVVKRIENVRTIKERPEEDVRIVSISVGGST